MNALEYVLDGLEKALELERELGVRSIEIDRALLTPPSAATDGARRQLTAIGGNRPPSTAIGGSRPPSTAYEAPRASSSPIVGLVFLHHKPLSSEGAELMARIIAAMGLDAEVPIVVAPPVPLARVTVVLGALALRKCFPGMAGGPGDWQRLPDGREVLITYSPEYILRFADQAPGGVNQIKRNLWQSLKVAMQRLRAATSSQSETPNDR